MKPEDLDDTTPFEPDDQMLSTVHARSRAFRKRRTMQRLTSVTAGVVVIALAAGIVWTRVDTSDNRLITLPAATSTTTTTNVPPSIVTQTTITGPWRPISIAGYFGPFTGMSLAFDGYGRWTGSDGCNGMSGTYKLDMNGIRFGTDIQSTKVFCGADHPRYLPIENAARSEVRDNQLTFFSADGIEIARFVRPDVTARIELPSTTITAGSKVTGHVIIENNTGHVIDASGCGGLFGIALGNDTIRPDVAWTTCLQPLPIPVGETSYPATFFASYSGCSTPAQGDLKACIPNVGPPPLPAGDYQARFFQSSPVVTPAPPIDVKVVP